jgi:hypothetical protein
MIQLDVNKVGGLAKLFIVRINLKDEISSDFDTTKGLLMSFTSQLTGATQNVIPIVNWGADFYNDRVTTLYLYTAPFSGNPEVGYLAFGNISYPTFDINYPIGFWDVIIYENSSSSNLSPTGLTRIWTGLVNVAPADADGWSPTYTEYTTNDSDTDSVYLTPN